MKIVIDARIINSSTGRYVERLLHYLEKQDHKNKYLILVRRKDLDFYKPQNSRFKIVEADFADYSFGEQLGLARLLYRLKPDLVHFCMPQQPLFYFGPSVTTVHDLNLLRITSNDDMGQLELHFKKLVFRLLLWIVVHKSAHIITPSQFTKADLLDFAHLPSKKVTVTYEGSDQKSVSPATHKHVDKPFLLYVGRAEPYKNNRGLIIAHQQLLQTNPDLHLFIVGKKDSLRLNDLAWVKENGFKNVNFIGFVSDAELAWLYQHCQAYVFPSLMEGFGLPGLEAMSCGAPVVSSNTTSLPEIYGSAAEYFDPLSIDDMVAAIGRVLQNKNRQKELVRLGHVQVAKYSWEKMAKQTLKTYKQLLKKEQK